MFFQPFCMVYGNLKCFGITVFYDTNIYVIRAHKYIYFCIKISWYVEEKLKIDKIESAEFWCSDRTMLSICLGIVIGD